MGEPVQPTKPTGAVGIEVILFDLGGVLVELAGMRSLLSWTGLDQANLWRSWLRSRVVRDFEAGRISPAEFAQGAVAEFDLPVSPDEFLRDFRTWPSALYPGIESLLSNCARSYRLGCLSNTNPVHWPIMQDDFGLGSYLDQAFISYQIGLLKPDAEIFRFVVDQLQVQPECILYFDDNQLNVEAAMECGIAAHLCRGGYHLADLVAGLANC